ncbi:MAG: hypothetical protein ACRDSP_02365 [Pseudonocardiaceae bacterium]
MAVDEAKIIEAMDEIVRSSMNEADPNPLQRYMRATDLYAIHAAVCTELTSHRAEAVRQMSEGGMSYRQIAAVTGLTKARVQQMVQSDAQVWR